jgi:hypothetical protein
MHYLPELFYLQDQIAFPFQKAFLITATGVSRWSSYYYARLITPKSRDITPVEQKGSLPIGIEKKETFITELVTWLFENSQVDQLFCLFLDDEPLTQTGRVAKFDHHDDTCCWVLNLLETEFSDLQKLWKLNGLPQDLFYPEEYAFCIPYAGTGLNAKLLRIVGVKKCFTPKQREKWTI